jgi:hypothetical protein
LAAVGVKPARVNEGCLKTEGARNAVSVSAALPGRLGRVPEKTIFCFQVAFTFKPKPCGITPGSLFPLFVWWRHFLYVCVA